MKLLNAYYDTRFAPVTFDFATFLVVAEAYRQKGNFYGLAVNIITSDFRNMTHRETAYSRGVKEWRSRHILLGAATLLPSVLSVEFSRLNPTTIQFPSFPATYPPRTKEEAKRCIPYLYKDLMPFRGSSLELRPFRAREQAVAYVKSLFKIEEKPLFTITLRTSNQQVERNSDLRRWDLLRRELESAGARVLVIPDFEDLSSDQAALDFDWETAKEVCFDMDLRLGLYSLARMNYCVLNGVVVPLLHSPYPVAVFKPVVPTVHQTTEAWLKNIFGVSAGENFWWFGEGQSLNWISDTDNDFLSSAISNSGLFN